MPRINREIRIDREEHSAESSLKDVRVSRQNRFFRKESTGWSRRRATSSSSRWRIFFFRFSRPHAKSSTTVIMPLPLPLPPLPLPPLPLPLSPPLRTDSRGAVLANARYFCQVSIVNVILHLEFCHILERDKKIPRNGARRNIWNWREGGR